MMDIVQQCLPFIIPRLELLRQAPGSKSYQCLIIGISGLQGCGKSTLATKLQSKLEQDHGYVTEVVSIDDFYLTRAEQQTLAQSQPGNPLVQHRGQPSTHDLTLAGRVLNAARACQSVKIPSYDKGALNGLGDRRPEREWHIARFASAQGDPRPIVLILEGWCLGFSALSDNNVERHWTTARAAAHSSLATYQGQLGMTQLAHVQFVNHALKSYDVFTNQLDAMIHLDAESLHYVYDWRQQQEEARRVAGSGMSVDQVDQFVKGYFSSYELYVEKLRMGLFDESGKQLRIVLDRDRNCIDTFLL